MDEMEPQGRPEASAEGTEGSEPSPEVEPAAVSEPASSPAGVAPVKAGGGRARWIVALGVTALVLVAASLALVFASSGGAVSRLAGWAPSGSWLYAEARLDPPGDQATKVAEFLAHFPGFADQSQLDAKLTETMDRLLGDASGGKITYTTMKPWLGDAVAVIGTAPPTGLSGSGGVPNAPFAFVLGIKDAGAARTWIAANAPTAGAATETHGGAQLTVETSAGQEMAYTVLDSVIVAGEKGAVEAVIDTKGAGSFASSDPFKSAATSLPAASLGFAFIDTQSLLRSNAGLVPGASAVLAKIPAWETLAFRVESSALRMDVALPAGGAPATTARVSTLAGHLPADTVAAFEIRDVRGWLTGLLDGLKATPQTAPAASQVEQAVTAAGGADGLVGWIGDASVVVTGSGGTFSGGLVATTPDATAATAKVTALESLFSLLGLGSPDAVGIGHEAYGEGQITTVDLRNVGSLAGMAGLPPGATLPSGDVRIAFTAQKGLFVIGLGGDAFVKSVVDAAPGSSLADQPRYKAAMDAAGSSNTGQQYVDVGGLVEAVVPLLPPSAQQTYQQQLKPFLDPLAAYASAGAAGDPVRVHSVLTLR